jgi:predicted Zn finger-like uncharacterized protein
MKISCDSCGAKYTVSDDKVQGKTVKVKCRKCSAVIVVSSSGQVTTTAGQSSSPGATSSAGGTYTVAVADGDQRNLTVAEIVEAYNSGIIDADTFLWAEGMDDWQALREVDAIVDALHAAASQSEAVSAADASSQQEDLGATVAMADGVSPFAPAPATGGRGSAAGPAAGGYGSAAATASGSSRGAGSGASYGASSSPAFGSGSGGLFGGGASPARGASGPGAMFPATASASTAARASSPLGVGGNLGAKPAEDSAIFSLNMLTAKVGAEGVVAPAPNFSEEEDSGLIDLKALAAGLSTDSVLSSPLDVTGGMGGVFPLGAPPPVAAPIRIEEEKKEGMSKLLVAILATAVLGLGAAVVFLIVRGGATPPQQAVVTVYAPSPSGTPGAATTTDDVASAEPPASASASATAKVAGGKGTLAKPKGTSTGGPGPGPGPGPTPKASCGCGCSADDLMCCMRCSQKKGK